MKDAKHKIRIRETFELARRLIVHRETISAEQTLSSIEVYSAYLAAASALGLELGITPAEHQTNTNTIHSMLVKAETDKQKESLN